MRCADGSRPGFVVLGLLGERPSGSPSRGMRAGCGWHHDRAPKVSGRVQRVRRRRSSFALVVQRIGHALGRSRSLKAQFRTAAGPSRRGRLEQGRPCQLPRLGLQREKDCRPGKDRRDLRGPGRTEPRLGKVRRLRVRSPGASIHAVRSEVSAVAAWTRLSSNEVDVATDDRHGRKSVALAPR